VLNGAIIAEPDVAAQLSRRSGSALLLAAAAFGLLWLVLCRHLSGEWSSNEQYGYGWFVPFFAAYCFWLRWEDRPAGTAGLHRQVAQDSDADIQASKSAIKNQKSETSSILLLPSAFLLLFLLLPVRLFEKGVPDFRLSGWVHAIAVVALTLLAIWRTGGWSWARHFAFPVCFILVAVPWPLYLEGGVTIHLMSIVAAIAAEAAALLGIPAQLEGNLLRLSTGVVGVDEACSGVRSLQTSIMIGLLFGELKRFDLLRRAALLAGAVGLAMVANVSRAVFLVWVASSEGIDAVSRWHDMAGYTIVGVVFIGTIGIAALLGKTAPRTEQPNVGGSVRRDSTDEWDSGAVSHSPAELTPGDRPLQPSPRPSLFLRPSTLIFLLTWLLAVEAGAELWYRAHERIAGQRIAWSIDWPEDRPGFRALNVDQFRPTLGYDDGSGATWHTGQPQAAVAGDAIFSYFFRWHPGRLSILRARVHRPDRCLPNIGWRQSGDHGTALLRVHELALPFRHFEFTRDPSPRQPAIYAHAFHYVGPSALSPEAAAADDRIVRNYSDELNTLALRTVLRGERERGQQMLQISYVGPEPVERGDAERRLADDLKELVRTSPLGMEGQP
jgi:exosortase